MILIMMPLAVALGDRFGLFMQTSNNAKKSIQFNIQLKNKIKLLTQRIYSGMIYNQKTYKWPIF